jgi:hypothetical protein
MWDASQRHNVAVSVHLRSRASGQAFWICTYHMYVLASQECERRGLYWCEATSLLWFGLSCSMYTMRRHTQISVDGRTIPPRKAGLRRRFSNPFSKPITGRATSAARAS